jgi:N-glycosylase/DNA lyase
MRPQCFRWTARPATSLTYEADTPQPDHLEWLTGHVDRTLLLRQDERGVHYRSLYMPEAAAAHAEDIADDTTLDILRAYFVLDVSLVDLIQHWTRTDVNFVKKTKSGLFGGIRVLKQDPWEALVSCVSAVRHGLS